MNVYSGYYYGWFKFIKDEFEIDAQINVDLDSFAELFDKSGIYSAIFSELVCVVSKYPKKVHRNVDLRLHNTKGSAVEWDAYSDDTKFECYYVNGRNVPADKYLLATENKITKEVWLQESNEDIKAAWFEILGSEKVMNVLEAKEIESQTIVHDNGELETHVLYKTPFKLPEIGEPLAWVKFVCPSTGSNYLISVNPKYKKVSEAVLSTCPFHGAEIESMEDYYFSARG